MSSAKILTIVGARPQFIKAAVVARAIRETKGISEVMVHTGQHFDTGMSAVFFHELGIPNPEYHLGIHGGGHGEMTGRMLEALEPVMIQEQPNWVVVYGDTNSTLAGALAAAKLRMRVAHVEAGLRSYNRFMPEEINRVVADHVSSLHLCPTKSAIKNLAVEGIQQNVHHVGDVMYDATLFAMKQRRNPTIQNKLGLCGKYAVATVHRAENTDDPTHLKRVVEFLRERARGLPIIFPLHPRTQKATKLNAISLGDLLVIEPLGYLDMAQLIAGASAVYTDSGGLQKEAYFHRVPCVTLRNETEWVETIEHGWNKLWSQPNYLPRRKISEYGDGTAGQKIVQLLKDDL